MLCLCHCNVDFVHFNMAPFTILAKFGWLVHQNSRRYQKNETMNLKTHLISPRDSIAGDIEKLPHSFLPHHIRPGFVRKDTIPKISLYLGNGRPHLNIYTQRSPAVAFQFMQGRPENCIIQSSQALIFDHAISIGLFPLK